MLFERANRTCDPSVELKHADRRWYVFIGISVSIWLGGFVLMLVGRCFYAWMFELAKKKEKRRRKKMMLKNRHHSPSHNYVENGSSWYVLMTNAAGDLVSGSNLLGKILVRIISLNFFLTVVFHRQPRPRTSTDSARCSTALGCLIR